MRTAELLVGTNGEGLWVSRGPGEDWSAEPSVPPDARIFSLAHAAKADAVFAGGAGCVYRRAGGRWERLPLPGPALEAWALAIDPRAPATLFAGCRPLTLLRSDDGGERWTPLDFRLPPELERPHTPRVTSILVEAAAIWCGIEVGGVFQSADRGEHWEAVSDGLPSLDIHALARGGALLAATPRGIARLEGGRWGPTDLDAPWRYCRALAVVASGRELLCGLGDGPPGTRGGVVRSEDDGRSWRSARLSAMPGSSIWSVATAADGAEVALAAAFRGELFRSEDQGRTWQRLPRTFTEVRAVLVA